MIFLMLIPRLAAPEAQGSSQTKQPFPCLLMVAPLEVCGSQLCPRPHTWLLQCKNHPTLHQTTALSQHKGRVGVSPWPFSSVSEKAAPVCICWQLVSLLAMNLWNVSLEKNSLFFFPSMPSFTPELKEQHFLPHLDPWTHSQRNLFFFFFPKGFALLSLNSVSELGTHGLDSLYLCVMSNTGIQTQKFGCFWGSSRLITFNLEREDLLLYRVLGLVV